MEPAGEAPSSWPEDPVEPAGEAPSSWPDGPVEPATGAPADDVADALFAIAEASIRAGLSGHGVPRVALERVPAPLRQPQGVFVTLEVGGQLNGCIGTIEAVDPLAVATARTAYDAAFDDPRLPTLRATDWPELQIEISLLSPLEPLPAGTRDQLLAALRPGTDGLLLADGWRRATFLPAMWDRLPDPVEFLIHLQQKAGMSTAAWPPGSRAWRYTAAGLCRAPRPLSVALPDWLE